MIDVDYDRDAACRGEHADLFFGPSRFEPSPARDRREAAAKAICATCVLIDPCRERALAAGELFGVWGGLGELERRALLEERARAS